jgi:hypothetical protein
MSDPPREPRIHQTAEHLYQGGHHIKPSSLAVVVFGGMRH